MTTPPEPAVPIGDRPLPHRSSRPAPPARRGVSRGHLPPPGLLMIQCGGGSLLPSPGQGSRAFVGRTGSTVAISQYDIKHRGILFASITLVSRCVVSKRVHGPAPQGGAVLLSERQPELPQRLWNLRSADRATRSMFSAALAAEPHPILGARNQFKHSVRDLPPPHRLIGGSALRKVSQAGRSVCAGPPGRASCAQNDSACSMTVMAAGSGGGHSGTPRTVAWKGFPLR
jgi:hypothetical protein